MDTNDIKLNHFSDGLSLADSVVSFDSLETSKVSFLSSALLVRGRKKVTTSLIRSVETSKLFLSQKIQVENGLNCQFNRPFSVGPLKLELLPAGSILGSSSLYLEHEGQRILYSPAAMPQKSPIVRRMQLKKSDILILPATLKNIRKKIASKKKEKERLLDKVQDFKIKNGIYPIVAAPKLGASQEIIHLLSEQSIPVEVHAQTHRITRTYEDMGFEIGTYKKLTKRSKNDAVRIIPLTPATISEHAQMLDRLIVVEQHLNQCDTYESILEKDQFYILSVEPDGQELKEIVTAVRPKRVLVFGNYIQSYLQEFGHIPEKMEPVYMNNQPPLIDASLTF